MPKYTKRTGEQRRAMRKSRIGLVVLLKSHHDRMLGKVKASHPAGTKRVGDSDHPAGKEKPQLGKMPSGEYLMRRAQKAVQRMLRGANGRAEMPRRQPGRPEPGDAHSTRTEGVSGMESEAAFNMGQSSANRASAVPMFPKTVKQLGVAKKKSALQKPTKVRG